MKTVAIESDVELTEEDKTLVAREAVRLTDQLDHMAEEFKDSRADWRRRIKDIKTKRDELNKAFMVGTERRTLDCVEIVDLGQKKAQYLFEGRVIKERELNLDEIADINTSPLFTDEQLDEEANEVRQIIAQETGIKTKQDLVNA